MWLLEKRCDKHGLIACKQSKSETVVEVSRQCEFHRLTVCSCGECEVKEDRQCEGKNYHTREVLRCPFHGLLQANMTHEFSQYGAAYHWNPELFRRMNLPVYDGEAERLEKQNIRRKTQLDSRKTEKAMRTRVEMKRLRVQEGQERILWSKQHGKETYGERVSDQKTRTGARANRKVFNQCPPRQFSDDSEQSDPVTASAKDSVADSSIWDTDSDPDMYISDVDSYDNHTSGCTCGASGRAHSRDCPLNPRSKSGNISLNPGLDREGQSSQSLNQRKLSREPLFQPGSYVAVHRVPLKEKHICFRVVEFLEKTVDYMYRLFCLNGEIP